jgi:hypothetical protein
VLRGNAIRETRLRSQTMIIQRLDREALREQFSRASPFPFVKIDNFLDPAFAAKAADQFPSFEQAIGQGKSFKTVNERRKVQVTDSSLFPPAVGQLNEALASNAFLVDLSYVTGIPNLLADEQLLGGGMHVTGPGGRLDVHVDFNYLPERKLHRRVNLLLYLNRVWEERWGGHLQLWDRDVKSCLQVFAPVLNRCIIFETSNISFHGVMPVTHHAPFARLSFAAYYYTREAPANWEGTVHSTVFKARPEERLRGYLLMPAEALRRKTRKGLREVKKRVKRLIGVGI